MQLSTNNLTSTQQSLSLSACVPVFLELYGELLYLQYHSINSDESLHSGHHYLFPFKA